MRWGFKNNWICDRFLALVLFCTWFYVPPSQWPLKRSFNLKDLRLDLKTLCPKVSGARTSVKVGTFHLHQLPISPRVCGGAPDTLEQGSWVKQRSVFFLHSEEREEQRSCGVYNLEEIIWSRSSPKSCRKRGPVKELWACVLWTETCNQCKTSTTRSGSSGSLFTI